MKRRLTKALTSLVCVHLALAPALASAEESEAPSPGRVLFKEGRDLVAQGKYSEACPKFEESLRLEVGVGTQFNLADCWEHIGKTASAQALFLGAAASAKAVGQSDREQVLRDRAAALEPRLTKLVIDVTDPAPKLSVKRDKLPIEADSFGKAVAVDPGSYTFTAKAPGKKTWTKTVEVKASEPIVTVEVPALEDAEPAADAKDEKGQKAAAKVESSKPAPEPAAVSNDRRGPNFKALALGGLGVAALGAGAFMGFSYKSSNDDAKAICPSSVNCTQAEIVRHDRLVEDARTARSWAYAGFGVGLLGLAGAAALFVVEQPKEPARSALHALPWVGAGGVWGAGVDGRF